MVVVPAETPLTTPVLLFTMATAVLAEDQTPPAFPLLEKLLVVLAQMLWIPLRVPALGGAETVRVRVEVALAHPPVPLSVYVMVTVPAVIPEMAPVLPLMVATAELLLVHDPPEVPLVVNVTAPPMQMFWLPLMVPVLGAAVTVTVLVAVEFAHPPVPVTV